MTSAAHARTLIGAHAGATRALSRFAKSNGANNMKNAQLALSSNDEHDDGGRSGSPSWRATPELDSKRQQQHLPPASLLGDPTLLGGLAGLVAKGTTKSMTSPSSSSLMSFLDALNKAKAAAMTEKARKGDAPCAQTTTGYQPRTMEEDEEEVEDDEVELRTPGPFDFGITLVPRMRCGCGYCRTDQCCRYAGEPVAEEAAEMIVRTRTPAL